MKEMPIFIKVEQYKEVLDILNLLREKLKDAHQTLETINDIKNKEDSELIEWHNKIKEIERKLAFIDKSLNEVYI